MNLITLGPRAVRLFCFGAFGIVLAGPMALSQQTPTTGAESSDEDIIVLNPFEVSADSETGWVATQSLPGSRLNTDLKDIAAPIEVLTKDFMDEFALNSIADATIYTTNVEGVGDNLEASTGLGTGTGFPPPTRVRVLGTATLSRDFFATKMSSDNYNLVQKRSPSNSSN